MADVRTVSRLPRRDNLIPGPNSTELAIHIGRARAGWRGLLVAGISFILPATLIVSAAAWGYTKFGGLPAATGLMYGVKPVVIAIVIQALWSLGRRALRTAALAALGLVSIVAAASGVHELVVLAGAAAVMIVTQVTVSGARAGAPLLLLSTAQGGAAAVTAATTAAAPFGLWPLFAVFVKAGALLFGSGYVLLAFLRADLVERLHWLSESQLIDAIAIGQVTPGPVFTTATFVGYVLGGVPGAAVATLAIFLPAFVFVALSGPLVPLLRRSVVAGAALDGVNAASLALMAVVSWHLGRASLVDGLTIGLAVASLIALVRFRVNSVWLIVAGGALGWLLH
jgi:chromate transporter